MEKRGAEHLLVQKKGRERDGGVCQICGNVHDPEGHHLIDYQYGGAASVDNIVTLCRDCHKEIHRGGLDLISF